MTLLAGERRDRERNLPVADAALLAKKNRRHIDLIGTLLWDENLGMAV